MQLTFLTSWQEEELRGAVVLVFANKQVSTPALLFIPVQEKISHLIYFLNKDVSQWMCYL